MPLEWSRYLIYFFLSCTQHLRNRKNRKPKKCADRLNTDTSPQNFWTTFLENDLTEQFKKSAVANAIAIPLPLCFSCFVLSRQFRENLTKPFSFYLSRTCGSPGGTPSVISLALKFSIGISALELSAHIYPTCRYVRPCISLNTSNWPLKLCGHILEYIYSWFMGKFFFRFFGPYKAGSCLNFSLRKILLVVLTKKSQLYMFSKRYQKVCNTYQYLKVDATKYATNFFL